MSYNPTQNPSNWQSSSSSNYSGNPPQQPDGRQVDFSKPVLSQDEIRVLRECNAESFYYRCIPMSTLFSGLAYIAMKNGHLKTSPNYGYFPKILAGIIFGYIGGKLSYQNACAEKIMKLPNSQLGENLRKRKGLPSFQESLNTDPGFMINTPSAEFPKESPIFDERRPDLSDHVEGKDSYDRVTESLSPYSQNDEISSQSKNTLSYDDLRKENREDYLNKIAEKYRRQSPEPNRPTNPPTSFPDSSYPGSSSLSIPSEPPSSPSSEPFPKRDPYFNPKKNKYGDVWDD